MPGNCWIEADPFQPSSSGGKAAQSIFCNFTLIAEHWVLLLHIPVCTVHAYLPKRNGSTASEPRADFPFQSTWRPCLTPLMTPQAFLAVPGGSETESSGWGEKTTLIFNEQAEFIVRQHEAYWMY